MSLSSLPDAIVLAVAVTGFVATLWDVRTGRIPNALTLGSAAVAVAFHAIALGQVRSVPAEIGWSAAGWIVGLLLFLPLFLLGGLGAGDVKLLAAFGAWLGPGTVCWAAIYGAIAGGLLAIPWLLVRGRLKQTLANVWGLLGFWRLAGIKPHPGLTLDTPGAIRMPYALPVSIGALIALWR